MTTCACIGSIRRYEQQEPDMIRICAILYASLALILSAAAVSAAEIRILSVGSVQVAIRSMAAEFAKETGHKIALKVVTPSNIPKNLASDPYDMIICSVPAMAVFDKAGSIMPGSRSP